MSTQAHSHSHIYTKHQSFKDEAFPKFMFLHQMELQFSYLQFHHFIIISVFL